MLAAPRGLPTNALHFDSPEFNEQAIFSEQGPRFSSVCPKKHALLEHVVANTVYDPLQSIVAGNHDWIPKMAAHNMRSTRKTEASTCAGPLLDDAYFCRNIWRVKQRLSMAGVRLAKILNSIYV
jgi:hypothetical protein